MDRPFKTVRKTFFDIVRSSKENAKFLFEHSDKLLVWIVGFSIGGITIIVANLTELNNSFPNDYLKIILIFLSISVISGIIFRIAFYFYFIYYKNVETYLEISFSEREIMNIHLEDVSQVNSISEMLEIIRQDFGTDVLKIANLPQTITEDNKEPVLRNLKSLYTELSKISKEDYDDAISFVKETYRKAFGISEKRINKIFSNYNSYKYLKFYGWMTILSFLVSCLAFMSVIFIFCFSY